ncbi:uncharacterized protein LOC129961721 isoform X2 [Argiope bruennichi]|uniref:uncharacterized protein LOC129961721 isoform X2 n=1 Tax=Argiope bruennichi TaxID=94029 RepID=UPI00249544E1|nr:uncharacterized protein LOC129961721 isoform X2 [Argiope bruennichi]
MNLVFCVLVLCLVNSFGFVMTDNRFSVNYNNNDTQPYVVGILSPSTTLRIDQASDNGNIVPPTDINLERRNTNSFQITSVTVQGSRRNDDMAYDSADDLDESHTEDLSSDVLDSSRADIEGYHSEDNLCDDLASPCGPIIFTQLPDRNMNLSIGVTPTYTSVGPVAGGVTMMTSKSESPISAQVPIMNPLPNNWQRRFKVVKIISSEPFKRGRWLCMDFKDPPADIESEIKPESNGPNTPPPTIQITNFDSDERQDGFLNVGNFAQVYQIPINQTYSGNFIMGEQEHMYGIILPQNEYLQPVTLVQDLSLQTTTDRNFNNIVNHQMMMQADPYSNAMPYSHAMQPRNVAMLINGTIPNQSPPSTQVVDIYNSASNSVQNPICANGNTITCDPVIVPPPPIRSRNNSESGRIQLPTLNHVQPAVKPAGGEPEETESTVPTGANTVAIDNKIEQAMDLVKSHLMFAVREEVEVLKEKITELLERISQLEHENDILRANASAETLKQLNSQSHKKSASGGTTGKSPPVTAIPPPST